MTLGKRGPQVRTEKLSFLKELTKEELATYTPEQLVIISQQRDNVRHRCRQRSLHPLTVLGRGQDRRDAHIEQGTVCLPRQALDALSRERVSVQGLPRLSPLWHGKELCLTQRHPQRRSAAHGRHGIRLQSPPIQTDVARDYRQERRLPGRYHCTFPRQHSL